MERKVKIHWPSYLGIVGLKIYIAHQATEAETKEFEPRLKFEMAGSTLNCFQCFKI